MIGRQDVDAACARIHRHVRRTPVIAIDDQDASRLLRTFRQPWRKLESCRITRDRNSCYVRNTIPQRNERARGGEGRAAKGFPGRMENQISTWLSQEARVGVKWKCTLG